MQLRKSSICNSISNDLLFFFSSGRIFWFTIKTIFLHQNKRRATLWRFRHWLLGKRCRVRIPIQTWILVVCNGSVFFKNGCSSLFSNCVQKMTVVPLINRPCTHKKRKEKKIEKKIKCIRTRIFYPKTPFALNPKPEFRRNDKKKSIFSSFSSFSIIIYLYFWK